MRTIGKPDASGYKVTIQTWKENEIKVEGCQLHGPRILPASRKSWEKS